MRDYWILLVFLSLFSRAFQEQALCAGAGGPASAAFFFFLPGRIAMPALVLISYWGNESLVVTGWERPATITHEENIRHSLYIYLNKHNRCRQPLV